MQINEDFFSGLDNFLEGFMGKASKKNAQSQQSLYLGVVGSEKLLSWMVCRIFTRSMSYLFYANF